MVGILDFPVCLKCFASEKLKPILDKNSEVALLNSCFSCV